VALFIDRSPTHDDGYAQCRACDRTLWASPDATRRIGARPQRGGIDRAGVRALQNVTYISTEALPSLEWEHAIGRADWIVRQMPLSQMSRRPDLGQMGGSKLTSSAASGLATRTMCGIRFARRLGYEHV